MIRVLLVALMLAATAGAVVAYGDPKQIARASDTVSQYAAQPDGVAGAAPCRSRAARPANSRCMPRSTASTAPMVIDTGATSVVLTWETAKADRAAAGDARI